MYSVLKYLTLALNEEPAVSSLTKGNVHVSVTLEGAGKHKSWKSGEGGLQNFIL